MEVGAVFVFLPVIAILVIVYWWFGARGGRGPGERGD